jgi:hypothetical protein
MKKPSSNEVWKVHRYLENLLTPDTGTPHDLECISEQEEVEIRKELKELGTPNSMLSIAAEVLELVADHLKKEESE